MKKIVFLLIGAVLMLSFSCRKPAETNEAEQSLTEENQKHLNEVQPPERLDWSLERDNISKRTRLWNDPNKVSYVYLISYGRIMAFYSIKGKVSSVNSQVTNTEQIARVYKKNNAGTWDVFSGVLPSPSEDGSYGTNGDAIFFFTTDGGYVEWSGEYMLADKPYKLVAPPDVVRYIETQNGISQ